MVYSVDNAFVLDIKTIDQGFYIGYFKNCLPTPFRDNSQIFHWHSRCF